MQGFREAQGAAGAAWGVVECSLEGDEKGVKELEEQSRQEE